DGARWRESARRPVEANRPPNHALHVVGPDSTEQLVDLVARHGTMTLTEGRLLKREGDMLPGSDPVRPPDNSDMSSAARATNQLCIISRDPLRAFIAALSPALRGCDELTIIVDRRQAENVAAPPAIERRQHPSVDAKVKTDGFALVPLSTTDNPKHPL